ncbi:hypothetical protein [Reichenbachiella ulvae]|uniref:DUF3575 domain-containing protein n=1 Tax=Reichenbachiella ulvae TaxID=2980104 RepID=A0ABT3CZD3_9BACT|nr:hypothetical protein [Reichenbachiella ulvae]MCV9389066.1 hypothetical protein [Reichenbachiella ulvae]
MKILKSIILSATLALLLQHQTLAQPSDSSTKVKLSIEIDPATFVFNGYGIHLRFQPKNSEHLLLGLGTYGMNMPDALVNFNEKNRNQGWYVRINQGYSLFAEHHFAEVNKKWFVGTQFGIQEYKIKNADVLGKQDFSNMLAMVYLGYTLKPFRNNLYIKPWAGVGYTTKVSGNNSLETKVYDIEPITMFATLHLGYTF